MIIRKFHLLILLMPLMAGAFTSATAQSGKLIITFTNIKKKGEIHVALWENEGSFLGKTPFQGVIKEVNGTKVVVTFDHVPFGTYAASVFIDTNANRKMDTNFMGVPKEPYAFSNNASGTFGPPKYSEASFAVDKNPTQIEISF